MLVFLKEFNKKYSIYSGFFELFFFSLVFCIIGVYSNVSCLVNVIGFFDETILFLFIVLFLFSTVPVNLSIFFNFIFRGFSLKLKNTSPLNTINVESIFLMAASNFILFLISFVKLNKVMGGIGFYEFIDLLSISKAMLSVEFLSTMLTMQYVPNIEFISELSNFNIDSIVFIDGVSLWLCWLLVTVSLVLSISKTKNFGLSTLLSLGFKKSSTSELNFILFLILVCFLSKDIFVFFTAFEAILLPLVFYTVQKGSRMNKLFAAKYLAMYTVVGSAFLWVSVAYVFHTVGASNFDNIRYVFSNTIGFGERAVVFFGFFIGFAFKVPVVPFHHWLIIAHVEAPTAGSIILAALLLKVGTYGIYRFVFLLFPLESFHFSSEIMAVSVIGFTYATISAVRQVDIKRYVAYTSIAHMNFSLVGLFSNTEMGVTGYIHTSISHGIIATAMFFLIGEFYSQVHFRDVVKARGLSNIYPNFSIFFFLFSMANSGLPLFSGFVGEYLILLSLSASNEIFAVLIFLGFMVTGVYNLSFINSFLFGDSTIGRNRLSHTDINSSSVVVLLILLFWSLVFGLFPDIILKTVEIA